MTGLEPLNALDRAGLMRLADLLQAKLLQPPFGELALQDHVPAVHVNSVSTCLADLTRLDVPPAHIALVLRALALGRNINGQVSDLIDVVVSGPDVAGVSRETGVVIRQLFNKARERVLAVGFAIHQGRSVFQPLADQLDTCEDLEATLCVDVRREPTSTSRDINIVSSFAERFVRDEWPGTRLPQVYYDPRSLAARGQVRSALHAKCVVVDGREALVTSANFTAAAQERNIELGLLVDSSAVAGQIEEHFYSLIRLGHLVRLPLPLTELPLPNR